MRFTPSFFSGMAGKEKKAAILRHMNKEASTGNDKSGTSDAPKKRRGRIPNSEKGNVPVKTPRKRIPRKTKEDPAAAPPATVQVAEESNQTTPQRSRKPFLEKELEDILENATGRNTPLEASGFFLPKSRREPEEDTLSVRSLSTFLRTRRTADRELEDDVLSLRSVKLRKDDDDTMSVRSLPGKAGKPAKRGRQPAVRKVAPAKVKAKVTRPKKTPNPKLPPPSKKKAEKTKETKQTKKPLRLQPKIVAKRRSNLMLKKKVRNAKIAVKRIYKKKAMQEKAIAGSAETTVAPVVKDPPVSAPVTVEMKEVKPQDVKTVAAPLRDQTVAVTEMNGDLPIKGEF